jgi:hypothetical protein
MPTIAAGAPAAPAAPAVPAAPAAPAAAVAKGADYSIPIPRGWAIIDSPQNPGGIAIAENEPIRPDAIRGVVVVTPVAPTDPPMDATNPLQCGTIGEAMASTNGVTRSTPS